MIGRLAFGTILMAAAIGCGGNGGPVRGPYDACTVPEGTTFTGRYYTNLGRMELTQSGIAVAGSWQEDQSHKSGRLEGTVEGCLLMFSWTQTDDTIPGRPRTTNGRGVFRLLLPDPDDRNQTVNFEGVWGYGTEVEGGGTWTGRRSRE